MDPAPAPEHYGKVWDGFFISASYHVVGWLVWKITKQFLREGEREFEEIIIFEYFYWFCRLSIIINQYINC